MYVIMFLMTYVYVYVCLITSVCIYICLMTCMCYMFNAIYVCVYVCLMPYVCIYICLMSYVWVYMCLMRHKNNNSQTVKPVLTVHIWFKETVVFKDIWPFKRDSIYMKLSDRSRKMWLFNTGDTCEDLNIFILIL